MSKAKIELFPYFIIRVCGGSLKEFEKLRLPETSELIEKLTLKEKQIKKIKDEVCDKLYAGIKICKDRDKRLGLIHLKRDVFNLRSISAKTTRLVKIKNLQEYYNLVSERDRLRKEIVNIYKQFKTEAKSKVLQLANNETFQKGLVLSSRSLYKQISNKNEVNSKTELGLIKYLSRFYLKSSPFSTFTSVGMGSFKKSIGNSLDLVQQRKKSFVRVNNIVQHYLERLLIENHDIAVQIPVSLNETISQDKDEYVFFANDENYESIQRLKITPALKILSKLISEILNVTISKLVQICRERKLFSESSGVIEEYLLELYRLGFLYFPPSFLGKINIQNIGKEAKMLVESAKKQMSLTSKATDQFGKMSASNRALLLYSLFSRYREICKQLYIRANLPKKGLLTFADNYTKAKDLDKRIRRPKIFRRQKASGFEFDPKQIFYEDMGLKDVNKISFEEVEPLIKSIQEFLRYFTNNVFIYQERKEMHDLFLKYYSNRTTVPLLVFYEKYSSYRLSRKRKDKDKYRRSQYNNYFRMLAGEIIKTANKNASFLDINVNNFVPPGLTNFRPKTENDISISTYIQFYVQNGKLTIVLNDLNGGYGRSFSRFLTLFDIQFTRELQRINKQCFIWQILAEDNDASVFNANVHPPLLDFEIKMPGSRPHYPKSRQLSINRLMVADNPETQSLELRDSKTSKPVLIFDLGFQGHASRSGLFKFLYRLGPMYNLEYPDKPSSYLRWPKKSGVTCFPRVYYGSNLVVWRQAWYIDRECLPYLNPSERDYDYFLRLNHWRIVNEIPEKVFIRVVKEEDKEKLTKKAKKKLLPDDYKPQYIDFINPFLVRLFAKSIVRVVKRLWIEEMLPTNEQVLKFDNKPFVSEFIFQWQ